MGLFSKKEYVCERCGKTFTARLAPAYILCKECWKQKCDEDAKAEEAVRGYIEYASKNFYKDYTTEQMVAINQHREDILARNVNARGISKAELQSASENYKKLSDEEAESVLLRISNSLVSATIGAVQAGELFVPTQYEGVVVDAESIFAVGYTSDSKLDGGRSEVILCAVFTNDPYIPVFPVVYAGELGAFEIFKSKKGRENVAALFETICPNLTYPVMDLKQLKKQLKADGEVKGNIELKEMLKKTEDAALSFGLFDTTKMHSELSAESAALLDRIGYMQAEEVDKILKMDKLFNKMFWEKQIKRLSKG